MDICDAANSYIDHNLRVILDKMRDEMRANSQLTGTVYCVDCGDEIPLERIKAIPGCCRCVTCQEEHDNQ